MRVIIPAEGYKICPTCNGRGKIVVDGYTPPDCKRLVTCYDCIGEGVIPEIKTKNGKLTEWNRLCNELEDILVDMKLNPEYALAGDKWIQVKTAGDKMDMAIRTGYCGECDIHLETIDAIRKTMNDPLYPDLLKIIRIKEMLTDD